MALASLDAVAAKLDTHVRQIYPRVWVIVAVVITLSKGGQVEENTTGSPHVPAAAATFHDSKIWFRHKNNSCAPQQSV